MANLRDAFARLHADDDTAYDIAASDHPACKRYMRWLCHEMLPTFAETGTYKWPSSEAEFDALIAEAVNAVRPMQ